MTRVILWDFDGTLAFRNGLWRGCLIETLDAHEPDHAVERDDLIPFLQDAFPWHRHEIAHPELCDPSSWWNHVEDILARAYEGVGFSRSRALTLAQLAHLRYVDATGWQLFDDTKPVLTQVSATGWQNVILSNHVPELEEIVHGLCLHGLVDRVVSSAIIGYEKPHPESFAAALDAVGPVDAIWMVGDNLHADVLGAEAVGIPAILVRTELSHGVRQSPDLWGVIRLVT